MTKWTVAHPTKLSFDTPVTDLHVRIINGTVNIVGTDAPEAHLQVSDIDGPPLTITHDDGILTVAYEDLPGRASSSGSTTRAGAAAQWSPSPSPHRPEWRWA
ncbi:hypothetical protein SHKM778_16200 [Streptomyces sp. KM77-8]|uniref:Uncharacterized protein n=1 Tax=Streptomyces haneummycinicus TaxID=3074435 RepID=A0AAT9HD05_9ACTN